VKFRFTSLVILALLAGGCSTPNPVAPGETPAAPGSAALRENGAGSAVTALTAAPAQVFTSDLQWTLTRFDCPSLWSQSITGIGVSRVKIRLTSLGNGTSQISVTESVVGTATDEEQRQFKFSYTDTRQLRAGSSFALNETNHFTLVGLGGAALRLKVGVTEVFRADGVGNVTLTQFTTRGPQGCEPQL
jgi:hypothetical protein